MIEYRDTEGKFERLPALAAELVALKVDVIVAGTNTQIEAARRATRTIPIVMVHPTDPVRLGFVASLARPGGNITGLSPHLEQFYVQPQRLTGYLCLFHHGFPEAQLRGVPEDGQTGEVWNHFFEELQTFAG